MDRVLGFLNTLDVDEGWDRFGDLAAFRTWCVDWATASGSEPPLPDAIGLDDLNLALILRTDLRDRAASHHGRPAALETSPSPDAPASSGDDPDDATRAARHGLSLGDLALPYDPGAAPLATCYEELPLVVRFTPAGEVELVPARDGVPGLLADVMAAVARTAADGTWQRIKICASDVCAWAFVDRSRNGSRRWCSMSVCGNREKTRTYRDRVQSRP